MKAILFLPLAYLVGIDGFAMFALYAIGVMAVAYLASRGGSQRLPVRVIAVRRQHAGIERG